MKTSELFSTNIGSKEILLLPLKIYIYWLSLSGQKINIVRYFIVFIRYKWIFIISLRYFKSVHSVDKVYSQWAVATGLFTARRVWALRIRREKWTRSCPCLRVGRSPPLVCRVPLTCASRHPPLRTILEM